MIKLTHAIAVAAAAFAGIGMFGGAASADSARVTMDHTHEQITVVGEGAISAAPDAMRITAGVEVREDTAAKAFKGARAAAAKLRDALVEAGVEEKDLRTNEVSLGPEYENYPKVAGYRAAQGVEAVVRDLSNADKVIDSVASIGEEARLNGISFELSDPVKALKAARARAFKQAAAKAKHYAELAGRPLGQVVSVAEDVQGGGPQPLMFAAGAMEDKAASITPGQQTVGVSVKVVYAFAD